MQSPNLRSDIAPPKSHILVFEGQDIRTATKRLREYGAEKLAKMITEKKSRVESIRAMIEAE